MIEKTVIEGRRVVIIYLKADMRTPCDKDEAEAAKATYEDGTSKWLVVPNIGDI